MCKCKAQPKLGLDQLTEDYNSIADLNYEYSFVESYGVLRDIQKLRHMTPSKKKKVIVLDKESRKKSLEVEHEKKILAIKKKDVEQTSWILYCFIRF